MASESDSILECEKVGEAMPDIAGIGILVGFSAQAFISLVLSIWVVFLAKMGRIELQAEMGTEEHESQKKRLELISSMLMVGNSIQMFTGMTLLITAFVGYKTIDLYHLHLVYDTVSFVGISNCAAVVCWTFVAAKLPPSKDGPGLRPRKHRHSLLSASHTLTYLFAIFFLVLTILLEIRLGDWSLTSEESGNCFRTEGIAPASANHPTSDKIYVGLTASWLLFVMFATVFLSHRLRKLLLLLSSLQFPVHIYMMIALRTANSAYLEGENENAWDFGQTTAALLLCLTIFELLRKTSEYIKFERENVRMLDSLVTKTLTIKLLAKSQTISQGKAGKEHDSDRHKKDLEKQAK